MKKYLITLTLVSLLMAPATFAESNNQTEVTQPTTHETTTQETVSQTDIDAQNKLIEDYKSSGDLLDDLFEDFASQKGIAFGKQEGQDKYFVTAQSAVAVGINDRNFAKHVVIAYEKALMNAQLAFIKDIYGTLATEKLQEFYSDSSTGAKSFTDEELNQARGSASDLARIVDKIMEVGEKKLDNMLVELGVDPGTIAKKSVKAKKDLFKDNFIRNITTKAAGSIAGLYPVQTFIAGDKEGGYSVGVIAMYSDKSKQVAKDIAANVQTIIKGKGKSVKDIVERDASEFPAQLGVRLAYDQNGDPSIISYGQWAYVADKSSNQITEKLKQSAIQTAQANADSQIIEFLKGQLTFADERSNGEIVTKTLEQEPVEGSVPTETSITDIIDKVHQKAKATASGSISGITTVKKWKFKENGHNYVGVVRVWSYSSKRFAENVKSGKGISQPKVEKTTSSAPKAAVKETIKRGSNYNVNDF